MMNKETRDIWFERMFNFWIGKLKFDKPIIIKKDNRIDCTCCIENWADPLTICVTYHTKKIGREPKYMLMTDIFHEIGHLVNKLPYNTDKEIIYSEYRAELFATKQMKKHYPKQYIKVLNYMSAHNTLEKLQIKEPIYYMAYIKIKDYKKTVRRKDE